MRQRRGKTVKAQRQRWVEKYQSGVTVSLAMMRADYPRRESLQGAFGADIRVDQLIRYGTEDGAPAGAVKRMSLRPAFARSRSGSAAAAKCGSDLRESR